MKHILLLTLVASGLLAADATGKWTGTFTPQGSEGGPALLVLKQEGAKVTGTAGPGADEQHEIQNGKAENGNITFEVGDGDKVMKFVLKQEGDEIKGTATRERDGQTQTANLAVTRAKAEELFQAIAKLDKALFDSYNGCDLEKFKALLTNDLEFYHDQNGLTVGSQTVTEQVKNNICGKARRELVAGTLQVYPLKGYGAVEIGVHRFYPPQAGSEATGEAKFTMLWQKKDDAWKLTRVISYDHVALKK
jgi:hypothetical protein